MSIPVTPLPATYDLIRTLGRNMGRVWCGAELAGLPSAPIYMFPDSIEFDSDVVERLAQSTMVGRLHLPHEQALFEVNQRTGGAASLVTYARETGEHIEAFLFQRCGATGRWTEVLCRAAFLPDGVADTEIHPSMEAGEEADRYRLVLTGMVWRSVGLLSLGHSLREHPVPTTRRPKLARAGVVGWTYRVASRRSTSAACMRRWPDTVEATHPPAGTSDVAIGARSATGVACSSVNARLATCLAAVSSRTTRSNWRMRHDRHHAL